MILIFFFFSFLLLYSGTDEAAPSKKKKSKKSKKKKKGTTTGAAAPPAQGTFMANGDILLTKPTYVVARFANNVIGVVSTVCHNGVLCDKDSLRKGDTVDAIALSNNLSPHHPARSAALMLLRSASQSNHSSHQPRRPRSHSKSEGLRSAQRNDVVEAKIVEIDIATGLTLALEPEFQPKVPVIANIHITDVVPLDDTNVVPNMAAVLRNFSVGQKIAAKVLWSTSIQSKTKATTGTHDASDDDDDDDDDGKWYLYSNPISNY